MTEGGDGMVGQRLWWYCVPSQSGPAGCWRGAGAGPRARGLVWLVARGVRRAACGPAAMMSNTTQRWLDAVVDPTVFAVVTAACQGGEWDGGVGQAQLLQDCG